MATAASENFTVILADRNRHVRELLSREFVRAGFTVKSFGFGREAAAVAGREGDVLVVDGDLPDMDAASVVRAVRESRPGMPVAVHAHEKEEAGDCLGDALVFFVPKADDPSALVEQVSKVMDSVRTSPSRGADPRQGR